MGTSKPLSQAGGPEGSELEPVHSDLAGVATILV